MDQPQLQKSRSSSLTVGALRLHPNEANQSTSGVSIHTTVRDIDLDTLSWAHDQLGSYLPTPDQARQEQNTHSRPCGNNDTHQN